jgi:hypothetical protein
MLSADTPIRTNAPRAQRACACVSACAGSQRSAVLTRGVPRVQVWLLELHQLDPPNSSSSARRPAAREAAAVLYVWDGTCTPLLSPHRRYAHFRTGVYGQCSPCMLRHRQPAWGYQHSAATGAVTDALGSADDPDVVRSLAVPPSTGSMVPVLLLSSCAPHSTLCLGFLATTQPSACAC